MAKRLHIFIKDSEYQEIRRLARLQNISIAKWVHQALRLAIERESLEAVDRKLAAIREAVKYEFPVGNIDSMLDESVRD